MDDLMEDSAKSEEHELKNAWIEFFCVVNFDLEVGQKVESVYPKRKLHRTQELDLAYMSFPDSNAFTSGDTAFLFKVRDDYDTVEKNRPLAQPKDFLYGFVYFRQKRDATISRGYMQKSVVIMTKWPFPALFLPLARTLGHAFFDWLESPASKGDGGLGLFEAAFDQICSWPHPDVDTMFELPFLGTLFPFRTPVFKPPKGAVLGHRRSPSSVNLEEESKLAAELARSDPTNPFAEPNSSSGDSATEQQLTAAESSGAPSPMLVSPHSVVGTTLRNRLTGRYFVFQDVNLCQTFRSLLNSLWKLWELVLIAEPILILSPTPEQCSLAVLGLVSLVSPLNYAGDFRPYFTVHDSDFKQFASGGNHQPFPPCILGVTNPFFVKSFDHYPHMLAIGRPPAKVQPLQYTSSLPPAHVTGGQKTDKSASSDKPEKTTSKEKEEAPKQVETTRASSRSRPPSSTSSSLGDLTSPSDDSGFVPAKPTLMQPRRAPRATGSSAPTPSPEDVERFVNSSKAAIDDTLEEEKDDLIIIDHKPLSQYSVTAISQPQQQSHSRTRRTLGESSAAGAPSSSADQDGLLVPAKPSIMRPRRSSTNASQPPAATSTAQSASTPVIEIEIERGQQPDLKLTESGSGTSEKQGNFSSSTEDLANGNEDEDPTNPFSVASNRNLSGIGGADSGAVDEDDYVFISSSVKTTITFERRKTGSRKSSISPLSSGASGASRTGSILEGIKKASSGLSSLPAEGIKKASSALSSLSIDTSALAGRITPGSFTSLLSSSGDRSPPPTSSSTTFVPPPAPKGKATLLWEFHEWFYSKHETVVCGLSKSVMDRLIFDPQFGEAADATNNEVLRRHFMQLTEQFLQPLHICFDLMWCSCALKSPFFSSSELNKYFPRDAFLDFVKKNGHNDKVFDGKKGEVLSLYKKFIGSVNFKQWLYDRIRESQKNDVKHTDSKTLIRGKTETQLIDLYLRVVAAWEQEKQRPLVDDVFCAQLESYIAELRTRVPADLLK